MAELSNADATTRSWKGSSAHPYQARKAKTSLTTYRRKRGWNGRVTRRC